MERLELSQELARDILHQAKAKGASQGDLLMVESDSFFVTVRLGEIEKISQAQEKRLGLRLFFGASSATASTSDISKGSIERLVDETCAMARSTAQDEYSGLPAPEECARTFLDLDLLDDSGRSLSVEERSRLALETEKTALDYDRRIINSE
ncbi:MAG: DNA gyrase modulator, partial [Candidatus Binatota bacterium]